MHRMYVICGTLLNYMALAWWWIRDHIVRPHSDSILFVAHPDDDALFFHTFIKENRPYVCLMTTGWSLRRMKDFVKCMKQYGVRFRAYPMQTNDERTGLLEKHVRCVLRLKHFKTIVTHNRTGEYGHPEHVRVHEAVLHTADIGIPIFCPVEKSEIDNYPLDDNTIQEKTNIFKKIYVTESWVPFDNEAGTPVWLTHERLEKIRR